MPGQAPKQAGGGGAGDVKRQSPAGAMPAVSLIKLYRPQYARFAGRQGRMIKEMARVHMTEAEVTSNFGAVLEKLRQGTEIVVEQDHRPVAIIRQPQGPGRSIDESIALAQAYEMRIGGAPVPDAEFAKDVQAAIDTHREPLSPPSWD